MLLDLEQQLLDNPIHVLQHALTRDVLLDLLGIFAVETPLRVDFRDVFELMVEVVVVELEWTDCFYLLGAVFVYAEGHDLLVVLGATVLLALAHLELQF